MQSTNEVHAIKIRARFEQLPLDVADGLLAHPQDVAADRGVLKEGRFTRDGSDRCTQYSALADPLARVMEREPPVGETPCNGRRPVGAGRPYVGVAQSHQSGRQPAQVVGDTELVAGDGGVGGSAEVASVILLTAAVRSRRAGAS